MSRGKDPETGLVSVFRLDEIQTDPYSPNYSALRPR